MKPILSRTLAFALVALATVATTPAQAKPDHEHAGGFFLRLAPGLGGGGSSITAGGSKLKGSGATSDLDIAIGGMVAPNVALHATLFGSTASNIDFDVDGTKVGSGDLTIGALGVGATFYIMPTNLYFTGTIGAGSLSIDDGSDTYDSDAGVAMQLGVGKEWWAGKRWGLGVAGSLTFHSFSDATINENWSGATVGVKFSATFN